MITVRLTPPPDAAGLVTPRFLKMLGQGALLILMSTVGALVMYTPGHDTGVIAFFGGLSITFMAMGISVVMRLPGMTGRVRLTPTSDALILTNSTSYHATTITLSLAAAATSWSAVFISTTIPPWFAAIAALSVSSICSLFILIARRAPIALTPQALTYTTWAGRTTTIPWDQCPPAIPNDLLRVTLDDPTSPTILPIEPTCSDPRIIAALINHYRAHPEQRHQLADPHNTSLIPRDLHINWNLARTGS